MDLVLLLLAVIVTVLAVVAIIEARGRALLGWLALYLVLPRLAELVQAAF